LHRVGQVLPLFDKTNWIRLIALPKLVIDDRRQHLFEVGESSGAGQFRDGCRELTSGRIFVVNFKNSSLRGSISMAVERLRPREATPKTQLQKLSGIFDSHVPLKNGARWLFLRKTPLSCSASAQVQNRKCCSLMARFLTYLTV
jgi:hypothetical protein